VTVNLHRDRPEPPPLEYRSPLCSVCGNEVDYVGGCFTCPGCRVFWQEEDAFDEDGEWEEPDAKRCTSVDVHDGEQVRCVRQAGHKAREHTAPFRRSTRMWRTGVAR
jgi:predicted amidophosphoribosyltransferase